MPLSLLPLILQYMFLGNIFFLIIPTAFLKFLVLRAGTLVDLGSFDEGAVPTSYFYSVTIPLSLKEVTRISWFF